MLMSFRPVRKGVLAGVVFCLGFAALAAAPTQAVSEKDYSRQPGYFDFAQILGDMESSVEVFLEGSLLVIAREVVKDEDPELGDVLSRIEYVRIQIFPAHGASTKQLMDKTRHAARQLEKKGWEMAVRARDKGEEAQIFVLPGENDDIRGLVVMAVGDGDEAVFINIVGDIRPAEIGRIVRAFHSDSKDIPVKLDVKGDAQIIVDDDEQDNDSD